MTESGDEGEVVVHDTEVSIDEMLSLACRQGKQDIVELLLESGASVNHRNSTGNTPLLEACSQGHVTVAKLLLDRGAEIDAPTDTTYDSALTWACTLGNEEIVKLLLDYQADVEHHTKDGCTALMFASLTGHKAVAKLLLDKKSQVNVESESNKDSPLTFACWKGHEGVVKLLLANGANVEHRTKEGFTPLMFAALGGHVDVAKCLLVAGAEVNTPSGSNNDIPMTSACWKGHHEVVKLLLIYNSDIEHRTKDGCTPLMLAAREGHFKVAHWLLMSGAKVNVPSGSENNIPLTLACWKGHYDVVKLLLQHTSNIEHHNKAGCTPLMLAAREGHYEVTYLLLEYNAEIDTPSGSNDDTPLTLSCWKGHTKIVELLLTRGAHVDHQTKTGCTPLMEATREGHYEVTKLLLENGADVEMPDNYGQSPLFMACWKGHAAVAQLLLEYRANIGCRTKTGITPLFQACRENHVDVVALLLDNGCSVNANFPNSRENPLTLAAEKGHVELAHLLLEQGANVENRTKKGYTPFFLASKEGHLSICKLLLQSGAETEMQDLRGTTPLVASFRNGHVEVVEWLLTIVKHLPSDAECQKCLMGPCPQNLDLLPHRTRCLEKIIKAKRAKELDAARNAQRLCAEIAAEEETKRKAAAKKRAKRKKKRAAKKCNDDEDKASEYPNHESEDEDLVFDNKSQDSTNGNSNGNSNGNTGSNSLKNNEPSPVVTKETKVSSGNNHNNNSSSNGNNSNKKSEKKKQPVEQVLTESIAELSVSETKTEEAKTENKTCELNGNISSSSSASNEIPARSKRSSISKNTPPLSPASISQITCSISTAGSSKIVYSKPTNSKTTKTSTTSITTSTVSSTRLPKNAPLLNITDAAQISMTVSPVKRTPKRNEITSPSSDTCIDNNRDNSSQGTTKEKTATPISTASASSTTASTATPTAGAATIGEWQEVPRTTNSMRSCFIVVPNTLIGRVIGKGGRRINTITDVSGAQITVSKATGKNSDRTVTIRGLPKSVTKAQNMISAALQSNDIESFIEQVKPAPRPHSAPSYPPEDEPAAPKETTVYPTNNTTPPAPSAESETESSKPASFGPIGSSIHKGRLYRSVEDISASPGPVNVVVTTTTNSTETTPFTPYSLYPTWPPTAFETNRARENQAVADGKMSYAEAVADNKNLSTEHPLLEGGWSSGESETESSSGNNEENDNATPKSREFSNTGLPDYMFAPDFFARSSSLLANNFSPSTANNFNATAEKPPSDPPAHVPPTSLSSSGLSSAAQKISGGQQRVGGGGAGGGGAAPHPFVPGSHLLMSNSQPAPTVPNISTQTIGAPTSLGASSSLGPGAPIGPVPNMGTPNTNMVGAGSTGTAHNVPLNYFSDLPGYNPGRSNNMYNSLLHSGGAWSLYNGTTTWSQDLENVPCYQWPLPTLLFKLGLSDYIPRLEQLKITVPQLAALSVRDLSHYLGFTESDAQRLSSTLQSTQSHYSNFYQSEILQYP